MGEISKATAMRAITPAQSTAISFVDDHGDAITIKLDDKTEMTSDLVRILGREYVAVAPIANRAFVNITKPASV